MTLVSPEVDDATQAIAEFGCPICGEAPSELAVRFISAIEVRPCEHLVFPDDARDMLAFYRELWYAALEEDAG